MLTNRPIQAFQSPPTASHERVTSCDADEVRTEVRLQHMSLIDTIITRLKAVPDARKYPKFEGNVRVVDSRDLWSDAAVSPKNQGYPYNHNAETYLEVGIRLGWATTEMMEGKK